jgi:predicted secreted hydrolase
MKSSRVFTALLFLLTAQAQEWQIAAPGYRYEFPRDHFNHPGFQTEWWYYNGNLHAPDGRRFGFELTFFRTGIRFPEQVAQQFDAAWRPDQIYIAHLALSDLDGRRFYHTERLNRAGPGLAGASLKDGRYWNGNWQVTWNGLDSDAQHLQGVTQDFTLQLDLRPTKPAVIQGQNGISRKGPNRSQASHYISFTRIEAKGILQLGVSTFQLVGLAWVDHEFFSESRNSNLAGWDWFAIQLDGNEELMIYRPRQKGGEPDLYSSGTYVDPQGQVHFLKWTDFSLQPGGYWQSPHSKSRYPLEWQIDVPSLDLHLQQKTALPDQELYSQRAITPSYWEGAVTYSGQLRGHPTSGVGYLEMTGYGQPVWFQQR